MSRAAPTPSPPVPSPPVDLLPWPAWAMGAFLLGVTILAYWPAFGAGYIWDDAGHVTRPDLRSISGFFRLWIPGQTQQYYPLLHGAFWIEHWIWGDNPAGYHAVNILLHAASACLFAAILRRLLVPGAWLAALLFALHPVGVESVAWISEQKNTLSTLFYLAAMLTYLRFEADRRSGHYVAATIFFAAALLTKSVTATLPAALLVICWWQRGRVTLRDVMPLLPWFLAGIAMGLFTAHMERTDIGAEGADFSLTFLQRVLVAGRVIWFYLAKLLWPEELLFIYPRWNVAAAAAWQYLFPAGVLVLLAGLVWWQRRQRGPLAAFLLFAGTLFPVLGFVNVFPFLFSFVADHFQYLASLAIFALAAAGIVRLLPHMGRVARSVLAGVLLTGLGALTFAQCRIYRDAATLYRATLAGNPACWMAHNNLAILLTEEGRRDEAITHLQKALALRPGYAEAEHNLGDNLNQLGRPQEALPHLQSAVRLQPNYFEAHYNLGVAHMALNRPAEGIAAFEAALAIKSDYALAHRGLGRALATTGQPAAALPHFERAVELEPEDAEVRTDLGFALMVAGRSVAAVPHLQEAVNLRPDFPEAHNLLGRALGASGHLDEAIMHFAEAVRLNPHFDEARQNLARARRQAGQTP